MKTAISIPDEIFESAERASKRMKISRSQLYKQALVEYLEKRDEVAITEALNAVYSSKTRQESIDSVLVRLQAASIPKEEW